MSMPTGIYDRRRPMGRRHAARRGAMAVEFAIVAPLFFLFLLTSFEFGWTNVMRHTADNAAYEAARHAMVPGATAGEAIEKAKSVLGIIGTRGANVRVSPAELRTDTKEVTVTIDVPIDQNALIVPHFMKARSIQASSTLRTERSE